MLRQGAPVREFTDPAALAAHYRALRERTWAPRQPKPHPDTLRAAAGAEARLEHQRLEAEAQRQAELDAVAAMDALVFQVLDPEQLAREPRRIIARIAQAFGLTYADVVGPSRTAAVLQARFAAIAAVNAAHPDWSLPRLGRAFGGRDHTTMLHALRKIERVGGPQPPPPGEPA